MSVIESGAYLLLSESSIRRHVRRFLIDKHGHICWICENTEWRGQSIPLVCDHVDGNSLNNDINNFRMICNNCDAQLPTYRNKNRGNGRPHDRERRRK